MGLVGKLLKEKRGRVLLVGGAGYVGTSMAHTLLDLGYEVRVLDNLVYGHGNALLGLLGREGFDFVYGDMGATEHLEEAVAGADFVVVLGGLVGDPICKKYPVEAELVNRDALQTCFSFLAGACMERVIFISTCSNYGLLPETQKASEETPLDPLSSYAALKVEAEQVFLDTFERSEESCPVVLRFATAFGLSPRMRFDLTVNDFTRQALVNGFLRVFDPDTWRPYCHVQDFARLIALVLEAPVGEVAYETFNAGGDVNNLTKRGLVNLICEKFPETTVEFQSGDVDPRNYRVSFEKVRRVLGFEPQWTIDDGVEELARAIRNGIFEHQYPDSSQMGNFEITARDV